MTNLHKRIKAIRNQQSLTQIEVADRAFLSLKTYQRIETGTKDPTEGEMDRLADALNCTPDEIRRFNLKNNLLSNLRKQPSYDALLAENSRLRQLVKRLFDVVFSTRATL